jgi:hypothetical protein
MCGGKTPENSISTFFIAQAIGAHGFMAEFFVIFSQAVDTQGLARAGAALVRRCLLRAYQTKAPVPSGLAEPDARG